MNSRFNVSLHTEVQMRHSGGHSSSDRGVVVGFTADMVEVRFGSKITRCSPDDLKPVSRTEVCTRQQESTTSQLLPKSIRTPTVEVVKQPTPLQQLPKSIPVPRDAASAKLQLSKPLVTTQRYVGTVKWARGSMTWLTCRALKEKYAGRDIFVHRNHCVGPLPSQWDEVSFSLAEVEGDPQGVLVKVTRPYRHC